MSLIRGKLETIYVAKLKDDVYRACETHITNLIPWRDEFNKILFSSIVNLHLRN